jgi:hypothetical protein
LSEYFIDKKISELKAAEQEAKNSINKHKDIIVKQQKNTINIEDSIRYINNGLVELGLNDFHIEELIFNVSQFILFVIYLAIMSGYSLINAINKIIKLLNSIF